MRVHHANIQVSDAAASLTFYRRLGLELKGCLRLDPVVLYYVGSPGWEGSVLELAANPDLEERLPGTGHLALAVEGLDALLTKLAHDGIKPETAPFHPADRRELRVCFVRDPDGVRVELIEGDFPLPHDPLPNGIT